MILYLDSSALVKRYVREDGSALVEAAIQASGVVGTAQITRAEVGAALAKAARLAVLSDRDARSALAAALQDWQMLVRVPLTDAVLGEAVELAWAHGLRGYDAVQLASALAWRASLDEPVVFGAFDRTLAVAATACGLQPLPESLVVPPPDAPS